jgi:hypothetical protein
MTAAQAEALAAGDADAPLAVETHYIQSNETRHDLWFPYIRDRGGVYVGVGSDQNYTLMAVAKARYVVLLDIDQRVTDVHRMYAILIPEARDPADLVDDFAAANAEATRARIEAALADEPPEVRKRMLRGFANGRETLHRHLLRVIERRRDGAPSSWLSDPEQFAHVQALFRHGRVRAIVGDLTGERSMQTAAAAAKALGEHVGVLYLSNAEEYFKYIPSYVRNVSALPTNEQSVVLRTIYNKDWEHADLWAYQAQRLQDFQRRLADPRNRSRNPMLRLAGADGVLDKSTGRKGLSLIDLKP